MVSTYDRRSTDFKVILGSCWDHFGISLGSFWHPRKLISGSFCDHQEHISQILFLHISLYFLTNQLLFFINLFAPLLANISKGCLVFVFSYLVKLQRRRGDMVKTDKSWKKVCFSQWNIWLSDRLLLEWYNKTTKKNWNSDVVGSTAKKVIFLMFF